jgi:hypothetical protein
MDMYFASPCTQAASSTAEGNRIPFNNFDPMEFSLKGAPVKFRINPGK